MIKWVEDGNYIEAITSENTYYCTGKNGEGLFYVDSTRNERRQILGTSQFSVSGVKNKRGKLRKALNAYTEE